MLNNFHKENQVIEGDCLDKLWDIPDKSVDMIFADLPYGTTACSWDTIIPFQPLWEQLERVIKDNGAMVFTASQPFTSVLVMSNPKLFRHEWIYQKRCASNFAQAKYAPMKEHESVLVFSKTKPKYFPIKEERVGSGLERSKYAYTDKSRHQSGDFVGSIKGEYTEMCENCGGSGDINIGANKCSFCNGKGKKDAGNDELRYPSSVQEFNNRATGDRGFHPTQKPVALLEYLIKTYTNEGDVVLDPTAGSGSTGVAAKNLNRKYILIEKEPKYIEIIKQRLTQCP